MFKLTQVARPPFYLVYESLTASQSMSEGFLWAPGSLGTMRRGLLHHGADISQSLMEAFGWRCSEVVISRRNGDTAVHRAACPVFSSFCYASFASPPVTCLHVPLSMLPSILFQITTCNQIMSLPSFKKILSGGNYEL